MGKRSFRKVIELNKKIIKTKSLIIEKDYIIRKIKLKCDNIIKMKKIIV